MLLHLQINGMWRKKFNPKFENVFFLYVVEEYSSQSHEINKFRKCNDLKGEVSPYPHAAGKILVCILLDIPEAKFFLKNK